MRMLDKANDLVKKGIERIKKYQEPIDVKKPDEHRIERELVYMQRVRKVNPRLQDLYERRRKSQERRSR